MTSKKAAKISDEDQAGLKQADDLEKHMHEDKNKGGIETPKKKAAKKKAAVPKKKVTKTPAVSKKAPAKKKAANAVVGKAEMLRVNPAKLIIVWEDNPRDDYGDMKTLEASILSRGVENPIRVKETPAGLKLEAGYRRTRACLNLIEHGDIKTISIPAILEKKGTTEKESLLHVFIENDGKAFNAMEEAVLFQEMRTSGMSEKEIGDEIGRASATIKRRLSLLKASEKLQQALRDGLIPLRIALRIIKADRKDHAAQEKLLAAFIKKTSGGDKEKVKEAHGDIAKASGMKDKSAGVPQHKAKTLLDDLASKYTAFARTQKPANKLNTAWVELDAALRKVRSLKRKGQFK